MWERACSRRGQHILHTTHQTNANPTSTAISSNSSIAPAVSPVVPPNRRSITCRSHAKHHCRQHQRPNTAETRDQHTAPTH